MTTKARIKLVIFAAALLILIPVGFLSLSLLVRFVTSFQEGADPASIFRGHQLVIPGPDQAQWRDLADVDISRAQQEEIIAAYWLAWDGLNRAHQTGDTTDLATYWAGSAYEQVLAGLGTTRSRLHAGHQLYMTFFSDDGSVVAFEDDGFIMTVNTTGEPVTVRASASVVMTLDQGFWRIRSLTLHYEPQP
jgi:hypothetical protein